MTVRDRLARWLFGPGPRETRITDWLTARETDDAFVLTTSRGVTHTFLPNSGITVGAGVVLLGQIDALPEIEPVREWLA